MTTARYFDRPIAPVTALDRLDLWIARRELVEREGHRGLREARPCGAESAEERRIRVVNAHALDRLREARPFVELADLLRRASDKARFVYSRAMLAAEPSAVDELEIYLSPRDFGRLVVLLDQVDAIEEADDADFEDDAARLRAVERELGDLDQTIAELTDRRHARAEVARGIESAAADLAARAGGDAAERFRDAFGYYPELA